MLWSDSDVAANVLAVARESRPDLELAAYIKGHREAAGTTQEDLAHSAEIALSTLQAIEAGRREPGWSTVRAILTALGLTLSDLEGELGR